MALVSKICAGGDGGDSDNGDRSFGVISSKSLPPCSPKKLCEMEWS